MDNNLHEVAASSVPNHISLKSDSHEERQIWSRNSSFSRCSNDSSNSSSHNSFREVPSPYLSIKSRSVSGRRTRNSSGSSVSSSLSCISDKDTKRISPPESQISLNGEGIVGHSKFELHHETLLNEHISYQSSPSPVLPTRRSLRRNIRKKKCSCCTSTAYRTEIVFREYKEVGNETVEKKTVIASTKVETFIEREDTTQKVHKLTFKQQSQECYLPENKSDSHKKRKSELQKLYESIHEIESPWAKNLSPDNILVPLDSRQAASSSTFGRSSPSKCSMPSNKRKHCDAEDSDKLTSNHVQESNPEQINLNVNHAVRTRSRTLLETPGIKNCCIDQRSNSHSHSKPKNNVHLHINSSKEMLCNSQKKHGVKSITFENSANLKDKNFIKEEFLSPLSTPPQSPLSVGHVSNLDSSCIVELDISNRYSNCLSLPAFVDRTDDGIHRIGDCFQDIAAEVVITTCSLPLLKSIKDNCTRMNSYDAEEEPPVLEPCIEFENTKHVQENDCDDEQMSLNMYVDSEECVSEQLSPLNINYPHELCISEQSSHDVYIQSEECSSEQMPLQKESIQHEVYVSEQVSHHNVHIQAGNCASELLDDVECNILEDSIQEKISEVEDTEFKDCILSHISLSDESIQADDSNLKQIIAGEGSVQPEKESEEKVTFNNIHSDVGEQFLEKTLRQDVQIQRESCQSKLLKLDNALRDDFRIAEISNQIQTNATISQSECNNDEDLNFVIVKKSPLKLVSPKKSAIVSSESSIVSKRTIPKRLLKIPKRFLHDFKLKTPKKTELHFVNEHRNAEHIKQNSLHKSFNVSRKLVNFKKENSDTKNFSSSQNLIVKSQELKCHFTDSKISILKAFHKKVPCNYDRKVQFDHNKINSIYNHRKSEHLEESKESETFVERTNGYCLQNSSLSSSPFVPKLLPSDKPAIVDTERPLQINFTVHYNTINANRGNGFLQVALREKFLTLEALRELKDIFNRSDHTYQVLIISGLEGCFCLGLDLQPLVGPNKHAASTELAIAIKEMILDLSRVKKPVVAAVDGMTSGLGVTLLNYMDVTIASHRSTFSMPYCALGYTPEGGATLTLPQAVGYSVASDLILRGRTLSAYEALNIGLINEVMSTEELPVHLQSRLSIMTKASVSANETAKSMMRMRLLLDLPEVLDTEVKLLPQMWLSANCQELLREALRVGFPWVSQQD